MVPSASFPCLDYHSHNHHEAQKPAVRTKYGNSGNKGRRKHQKLRKETKEDDPQSSHAQQNGEKIESTDDQDLSRLSRLKSYLVNGTRDDVMSDSEYSLINRDNGDVSDVYLSSRLKEEEHIRDLNCDINIFSSNGTILKFCDNKYDSCQKDLSEHMVDQNGNLQVEKKDTDGNGKIGNELEELEIEGAVGGVDISFSHGLGNHLHDIQSQQQDKDMIDEGAICDLDGIFQTQDNDKNSMSGSSDECSNSDSCYRQTKKIPSDDVSDEEEDLESECGVFGRYYSSHLYPHSVVPNDDSKNTPKSFYSENVEWTRGDRRLMEGDHGHEPVLLNANNFDDSAGEDNGDFIDTDLPSNNKHILSSSDEMDNVSSEEENAQGGRGDFHGFSTDFLKTDACKLKDAHCIINVKDVQQLNQDKLERLSLGIGANLCVEPDYNYCKHKSVHNIKNRKSLGCSSCDSRRGRNKSASHTKKTKHLSENSDSDSCSNDCDSHHHASNGNQRERMSVSNRSTIHNECSPRDTMDHPHLPLVGAASSSFSPQDDKAATPHCEHFGADGVNLPTSSSSSCSHSGLHVHMVNNSSSSSIVSCDRSVSSCNKNKTRDWHRGATTGTDIQSDNDNNPALSASGEHQCVISPSSDSAILPPLTSPNMHDLAASSSFAAEGSACVLELEPCSSMMNDLSLSASGHHSHSRSANILCQSQNNGVTDFHKNHDESNAQHHQYKKKNGGKTKTYTSISSTSSCSDHGQDSVSWYFCDFINVCIFVGTFNMLQWSSFLFLLSIARSQL